jgi:transcriptional regulator with XRE-family HTH domain
MTDMKALKQGVGAAIKDKRREEHLNQTELAAKVGKTRFWLTAIETGVNFPTIEGLYALADALGCPVADLLPLREKAGLGKVRFSGARADMDAKTAVAAIAEEVRYGKKI